MSLASPCISVCQMDEATGWCRGCYRTLAEIAVWGQASETEQREVLADLPSRHRQANFPQAQLNPAIAQATTAN